MRPDVELLAGLAGHLGAALAFADDCSQVQQQLSQHRSTPVAMGANTRSCLIGLLRDSPLDGHRLIDRYTDLNKIELHHLDEGIRYWMKSATAVTFTFERAQPMFSFPSDLHVLAFTLLGEDVEFQHAPISQMKVRGKKRYKLEEPLMSLGTFPLGISVPPEGYPRDLTTHIFERDVELDYDDLFDERGDEGEAGSAEETA